MMQTFFFLAASLPIMGWWGIPEKEVSRARYREAREAGFTHLMQFAASTDKMLRYLDMAEAEGLKLEVKLAQMYTEPEKVAAALKDHPALAMYHVKDEPPVQDFAKWAGIMKRLSSVDPKHPCYLNLLADSTDPQRWLGVPKYEDYLARALEEMPLPFLSADYYPCMLTDKDLPQPYRDPDGRVVVKDKWYNQLEIISAAARRKKLMLSLFACDVAHYNVDYVYPVPTLGQLRLQQYVNLAYGAQFLQYFTYWNPDPNGSLHKFHESIIRFDGTRGEVYDLVRALNRELQARASAFLGFEVVSVRHTGETIPMGTTRLEKLPPWVKSLSTPDGGAVVSHLRKDGFETLCVVNRSPARELTLDIAFGPGVRRVLDDGGAVAAEAYCGRFHLPAGYAEVFVRKGK